MKSIFFVVLVMIFFYGCAKNNNIVLKNVDHKDVYFIEAYSNKFSYGMTHKKYENSTYAVMQQAALFTKFMKKKYFAIRSPKEVSNIYGSLMNTPAEFFEKCAVGVSGSLTKILDPCKIHHEPGNGWYAWIEIELYDDKQHDFLVYNANEVISYLKSFDLYDMDPPYVKFLKEQ